MMRVLLAMLLLTPPLFGACSNTSFTGTTIKCMQSAEFEGGAGSTVTLNTVSISAHDAIVIWCEINAGTGSFSGVKATIGGTDYPATAISASVVHWDPTTAPTNTDQLWWVPDTGAGTSAVISCGATGQGVAGIHLHSPTGPMSLDVKSALTGVNSAPASQSISLTTTIDGDFLVGFFNYNNSFTPGSGFASLDGFPIFEGAGQTTHGSVNVTGTIAANDSIVEQAFAISAGGTGSAKTCTLTTTGAGSC